MPFAARFGIFRFGPLPSEDSLIKGEQNIGEVFGLVGPLPDKGSAADDQFVAVDFDRRGWAYMAELAGEFFVLTLLLGKFACHFGGNGTYFGLREPDLLSRRLCAREDIGGAMTFFIFLAASTRAELVSSDLTHRFLTTGTRLASLGIAAAIEHISEGGFVTV